MKKRSDEERLSRSGELSPFSIPLFKGSVSLEVPGGRSRSETSHVLWNFPFPSTWDRPYSSPPLYFPWVVVPSLHEACAPPAAGDRPIGPCWRASFPASWPNSDGSLCTSTRLSTPRVVRHHWHGVPFGLSKARLFDRRAVFCRTRRRMIPTAAPQSSQLTHDLFFSSFPF